MNEYKKFSKKRILIWGYGREGRSTERFLSKYCDPLSVDIFEGQRSDICDDDYDYVVKSPGIAMDEDNEKYTSQTQIFLECFRDRTIGITGTKGKSTTSALMHHVLVRGGKKAILLGNIGAPCLDYFGQMTGDDEIIAVFEMSCHQLAHLTVSPHIAFFLNLYEEHLDYYKTLDKYFDAKAHIARFMTASDNLFAGDNVPPLSTKAAVTVIDHTDIPSYDLRILGHHNDLNAHFVYTAASTLFGLEDKVIFDALSDFEGLPHRLQYIGTKDGIDFYDDSISTIPSATIQALSSVPNAKTVLIGGMDRGIDYGELTGFIDSNGGYEYIFAYASGKRIYDSIKKAENCHLVKDLAEAVKLGISLTPAGHALILSPAAASYGDFKNFEERGDAFRNLCGL